MPLLNHATDGARGVDLSLNEKRHSVMYFHYTVLAGYFFNVTMVLLFRIHDTSFFTTQPTVPEVSIFPEGGDRNA